MKTFKNSRRAGISLVALVITIIVLIILTGAVIVTFMEGGIIDRAKESVFKNDMRTYQEILALKRAENQMEVALGEKEPSKINATTIEDIQAIIPEFKEEYEGLVVITDGELSIGERVTGEELSSSEELYRAWLDDLGIGLSRLPKNALALVEGLEVGDYVSYTPDGTIPTELPISLTRQNINWQVLRNDGRQVTLISETPIDRITLNGMDGFFYGPSNIDETYAGLYSGSKGIARNLKVEDINEIFGLEIGEDLKPNYENAEGDTILFDKRATLGDVIDDAGFDVRNWDTLDQNINYRDCELWYGYDTSKCEKINENAYDLIFGLGGSVDNIYWLSSNCVFVNFRLDNLAEFTVRNIESNMMLEFELWTTHRGNMGDITLRGRPIVILNSDVEVANPAAGGDTVDTAWMLK